jgi:mannose-6-phosphate isomerase
MYKLKGVVQHYSWGGTQFIPDLIGLPNNDKRPFAEYWLGAHPASPAVLQNGTTTSLYEAIQSSPQAFLGSRVQQQFGSLPYLFKILDVRQMLSIQVHPSIESAIKGFAEEDEKGVPLKAPHRNYKDKNHKPELMAALSDFWLLHGFKPEAQLRKVFEEVPELQPLQAEFEKNSYNGLYESVMTMPQEGVDEMLAPLLQKIVPQYEAGALPKSSEHFWAARAVLTFCNDAHYDRGIFSIYFFNLLHLKKGEGIYQPAGLPHAYLEGQNVEVMANSDNVLRAGLTDKHIDVAELMKHVTFEPTLPKIIPASREKEQVYKTPAGEFELTKLTITQTVDCHVESATVFFVTDGRADLQTGGQRLPLERGEAALVMAGQSCAISPAGSTATVFAVTTPVGKN